MMTDVKEMYLYFDSGKNTSECDSPKLSGKDASPHSKQDEANLDVVSVLDTCGLV